MRLSATAPRRTLALLLPALVAGLLLTAAAHAQGTTPAEAAAIAAAHADRTAYVLPPDRLAIAEHLSAIRTPLHFIAELWSILVVLFLLTTRTVARMRNFAVNVTKSRWGQCFLFFFLFLFVTSLLDLPFGIYRQHLARAYGLSVQGWGSWLGDEAKSFLLVYAIGGLIVMGFFTLLRRYPRRWWIGMTLGAAVFIVAAIFISPYVIDPLFNRFEPLTQSNPALVDRLEKVVARGEHIDIPPDRMFLMKASDKVTTLNAYVTGFGSSKRVVVWDTTATHATPDEISFIFAHEMGHYVLNHIVKGVLFGIALSAVFFLLAALIVPRLLTRYGAAWRVPAQDNWAALAVFFLLLLVYGALNEPIAMTFTRAQEHAADVFGQEAVHGIVANPQQAGRDAFQLLGENGYSDPFPSPFVEFWTYSHPAIGYRAAFARHYDPWAPGTAPKYFPK